MISGYFDIMSDQSLNGLSYLGSAESEMLQIAKFEF